MSVTLRPLTSADIPAAMDFVRQAQWNQTPADWRRFLAATPDGCFAACSGADVVGTVTTIIYDRRLAWIGMMLVDERHRGQGIGRQLFSHALEYLDSRGVNGARLDATSLGRPLYEHHGFVSEETIERWVLTRSDVLAPAVPVSPDVGAIDAACALDTTIFGADRTCLLRSVADDSPEFALAAGGGATRGYAFGRHGTRADHLGPWMARDEEAARTLLTTFLARSRRPLVFVDAVCRNGWARQLLEAHGFTCDRSLTRMSRGTAVQQDPDGRLGAILGFEFG
jgi:GNAT superfamily N-acetyltransferase